MAAPLASVYNDFAGLAKLRAQARDGGGAVREVAQQFEALFVQMLLKSMRAASLGEGIGDSDQTRTYQEMFDQQLAVTLSTRGEGLGIAQMLMRQLQAQTGTAAGPEPAAAVPGAVAALPTHAELAVRRPLPDAAAAAAAPRPADQALPAGPVEFVRHFAPYAKRAADALGVSVRAVLSQAALETGWGRHVPRGADGRPSFNLFGIKAGGGWQGPRIAVPTLEFEAGVPLRRAEVFRAYAGPEQAFADYARLLGGDPRYARAAGHGDDVGAFARALQEAGYATDPAYAEKLAALADSEPMRAALAAHGDRPASAAAVGGGAVIAFFASEGYRDG